MEAEERVRECMHVREHAAPYRPSERRIDGRTRAGEARSTSSREYEEDASALKTDEGRGDRRNVQGELHTSEEP